MDDCKAIMPLLEEENRRIFNSQNIEQLLENSKLSQSEVDKVKNSFNDYLNEIERKENLLSDVVKATNDIAILIGKKSQQFHDDNMNSTKVSLNSEEDEEKLALEKATLNLQYSEKNKLALEILDSLKCIDKEINKITKSHAMAVTDVELCERNLNLKEKRLEEIEHAKLEKEAAQKELERQELERIKLEAKEAEQRKKEMERMKAILEEEEANKTTTESSENFLTLKFDVENGEFGSPGIGCFIKTLKDKIGLKSDLLVTLVDPLTIKCHFDATDEIVSNIIDICPTTTEDGIIQFENAFSVILPHSMARTQARETKIYKYDKENSTWTSCDTQDITIDDADKSGARFVEAIFDELPLTVTVLSVPKVEEVEYGKKGTNWSASVDSRVNVTMPSNAVKVNLKMKITTLAFDSNFTQDVKLKSKGTVVDNIYTFTHLLKIESPKKKLLKPGQISLPLAQKQLSKSDSASMPMPVMVSNSDTRPKASFGATSINDLDDEVRLLSIDSSKQWQQNKNIEIEIDKKKDLIKFEFPELRDMTFLAVRVKPEASPEQISKGVSLIMDHFKLHQIKITVTNSLEDLNKFVVMVCPSSKIDKQMRLLQDEGFNHQNPLQSQEIEVKEREILTLRLRGNIRAAGKEDNFLHKFMYCSQLKNKVLLKLEVVDKYAQRVKPTYQGFLTVTMSTWSKKPQPKVEGQTRKGPPIMIDVEEIIPLYEVIVSIPKITDTPRSKATKETPFTFVTKDSIDPEFVKKLALKLKNDWKPLAKALDLSKNRIEEISCMLENKKEKHELAYEVLKVWIMNLPVSKNKESILKKALININREDLAQKMLPIG